MRHYSGSFLQLYYMAFQLFFYRFPTLCTTASYSQKTDSLKSALFETLLGSFGGIPALVDRSSYERPAILSEGFRLKEAVVQEVEKRVRND